MVNLFCGMKRVNISLDTVSPDQYNQITRRGKLEKVIAGIRAAKNAGLTPIKINVVKLSTCEQDFSSIKEFAVKEGAQVRFISQMDLRTGEFEQVEGGNGGNCVVCNRLRLTANGMIKPCLFGDNEYNVRKLGIENAFMEAMNAKPKSGTKNLVGNFYNIGG